MSRRSWSSRFASAAAICALLLKAAIPLLAVGAAQMRGVPVAEICPLYGVALSAAAPAIHDAHAHHHHHGAPSEHGGGSEPAADHGDGGHCALTALVAFAAPGDAPLFARSTASRAADGAAVVCSVRRDACARWAARLEHGPPRGA